MPLRRVGILGGNNPDAPEEFHAAAARLGQLLADTGVTLLYDGHPVGSLAELLSAFGAGTTQAAGATELTEHADALLALPGGSLGLEEVLQWCGPDSGDADKPCGLLNTANYFTDLLQRGTDAVIDRFVRESQRGRLIVSRDPADLLRALQEFRSPEARRRNP